MNDPNPQMALNALAILLSFSAMFTLPLPGRPSWVSPGSWNLPHLLSRPSHLPLPHTPGRNRSGKKGTVSLPGDHSHPLSLSSLLVQWVKWCVSICIPPSSSGLSSWNQPPPSQPPLSLPQQAHSHFNSSRPSERYTQHSCLTPSLPCRSLPISHHFVGEETESQSVEGSFSYSPISLGDDLGLKIQVFYVL